MMNERLHTLGQQETQTILLSPAQVTSRNLAETWSIA